MRRVRTAAFKLDGLQKYALAIWFVMLCDPQWWIASYVGQFFVRVPLIFIAILAIAVMMKQQPGDWLGGLLVWVSIAAINLPFAYDRGQAMQPFRSIVLYYIIGLCIVRTFRTPRSTTHILFLLFVGQYLWWGLHGLRHGLVAWHPDLANFDGYGPLMSTGVGPGYFYATGASTPRRRKLGYLAAALSVIGVVNSFARGAVLALCVTVVYIWARSPNKGRTAGYVAAAGLIVAIAASLINGKTRGADTRSSFWSEMSTMFDDSKGSTGDDRKVLWAAAVKVWEYHPILGAGINNFGPAAATEFKIGDVGGSYAENPKRLYDRALHSIYFQILSEFGLAGVLTFGFLLVQFWRRNHVLFTPAAAERWRRAGGQGDLRSLALGLESGMVGFLVSGAFFNQMFSMWFYGLIIATSLLYHMVKPSTGLQLRTARVAKPRPA